MIAVVEPKEVLASAWTSLGLPVQMQGFVSLSNEVYLSASLRRLAGYLCPCSPKTLTAALVESHQHLTPRPDDFRERIEQIVEDLVAAGDLLELSNVATIDESVRQTWVFAAPPAFVARPSGSVFLIGLAPDEASPVPAALRGRLRFEGSTRVIDPVDGENLVSTLRDQGLRQLSAEAWLRLPKAEDAKSHRASADAKLATQGPSGDIAGLRIRDTERPANWYADRWVGPGKRSGRFVIRRPQDYGADLWGYAELVDGAAARLVDLPPPGNRWRGCDMAWRLQMAIDHCRGFPQRYRARPNGGYIRFDFFSPIPIWARRRLAVIGRPVAADRCLLSFLLPAKEAAAEEEFLQCYLFLGRTEA